MRRGPIQNEEILNVSGDKLLDASMPAGKMENNAIQLVENIDVQNVEVLVAADSTGIKEPWGRLYLDSEDIQHMKAAYLDLGYIWAPTADGTIQLYNLTDGVTVWESPTFTGGESSERTRFTLDKAKILAGKEYKMRINITVAGAAGEQAKITRALLKIVKGVS
ncbi:MAG: hypothetical protein QW577_03160 [Candidatus Bathyarchaeia archaeon]